MASESIEGGNRKTRKRSAAKAASGQKPKKLKATIHITAEADQRLSIHATMMKMDRSELVEFLIENHLKRYVVQDRGGEVASGDAAA
jgi:hypothetical protein